MRIEGADAAFSLVLRVSGFGWRCWPALLRSPIPMTSCSAPRSSRA